MKMVPSAVSALNRSSAEARLHALLTDIDLGPGAAALHSLNLSKHEYKRMGEIDFVLVSGAGVLVLEVKGGRVRRRDSDGKWEYTNRFGEVNERAEGPFEQSRSAMFALEGELRSRVDRRTFERTSFGYAVVFPDFSWTADSVNEPSELVIDEREMGAQDLRSALRRLERRWQQNNNRSAIEPSEVKELVKAMRPNFDLVPSLRSRAAAARDRFEALTEEQYIGLDWVQDEARLLVSGGAGTGKTMLAAEIARRDRRHGSVLLTCKSPTLATYLAGRVDSGGIDVLDIDAALSRAGEMGPWDVIVVDEAQDVLSERGIDDLDLLVQGGSVDGRWRLFYDSNNQAGFYGPLEPSALAFLIETGARAVTLSRNCRNAKPVILHTQTLTGADLGTPIAGEGPKVGFDVPEDKPHEAALLTAEIARLSNAGVSAGSITIVGPKAREDSALRHVAASLARTIQTFGPHLAPQWPVEAMTYSTVLDFKGFENDFVLLIDLDSLGEDVWDSAEIYVALSRPRYGLWMAVPSEMKAEFDARRIRNHDAVLQSMEGRQ